MKHLASIAAILALTVLPAPAQTRTDGALDRQTAGGCALAGRAASTRMAMRDAAGFMSAPEPGPAAAGPGPMIL